MATILNVHRSLPKLGKFGKIFYILKSGYLGAEKREVGGSVHRSGVALDKAAGTASDTACNGAPTDNETRIGKGNLSKF